MNSDSPTSHMAVYRFEKIWNKDSGSFLETSLSHNLREQLTSNVDPHRVGHNVIIVGDTKENVLSTFDEKKRLYSHKSISGFRANSVLLIDHLISTSREYFYDSQDNLDGEKRDNWIRVVTHWLREIHGDNLLHAVVHLDELTPHVHAITVPIFDGYFDATAAYSTKRHYHGWQDKIGEAFRPLGIKRGLIGSKASNEDLSYFYKIVNQGFDEGRQIEAFQAIHSLLKDRTKLLISPGTFERLKKEVATLESLYKENAAHLIENKRIKKSISDLRKHKDSQFANIRELPLIEVVETINLPETTSQETGTCYQSTLGRINVSKRGWVNIDTQDRGETTYGLLQHLFKSDDGISPLLWLKENFGEEKAIAAQMIHMYHVTSDFMADKEIGYEYPRIPDRPSDLSMLHQRTILSSINTDILREHHEDGTIYLSRENEIIFSCIRRGQEIGAEKSKHDLNTIQKVESSAGGSLFFSPTRIPKNAKFVAVCGDAFTALHIRHIRGMPAISIGSKEIGKRPAKALIANLVSLVESGIHLILYFGKKSSRSLKLALESKLKSKTTNAIDTHLISVVNTPVHLPALLMGIQHKPDSEATQKVANTDNFADVKPEVEHSTVIQGASKKVVKLEHKQTTGVTTPTRKIAKRAPF